jgi:hypothetical protein
MTDKQIQVSNRIKLLFRQANNKYDNYRDYPNCVVPVSENEDGSLSTSTSKEVASKDYHNGSLKYLRARWFFSRDLSRWISDHGEAIMYVISKMMLHDGAESWFATWLCWLITPMSEACPSGKPSPFLVALHETCKLYNLPQSAVAYTLKKNSLGFLFAEFESISNIQAIEKIIAESLQGDDYCQYLVRVPSDYITVLGTSNGKVTPTSSNASQMARGGTPNLGVASEFKLKNQKLATTIPLSAFHCNYTDQGDGQQSGDEDMNSDDDSSE